MAYKVVKKNVLNPQIFLMEVEAPLVAKKAEPGQFIILRIDEYGERVPFTIADFDREKGTVTIIVQIVGKTTKDLAQVEEGEEILDFAGTMNAVRHTLPTCRWKHLTATVFCLKLQTFFRHLKYLLNR